VEGGVSDCYNGKSIFLARKNYFFYGPFVTGKNSGILKAFRRWSCYFTREK